ncbi:MAG: TonB C-terminal domain-containing protein, partial [Porticoccaceae bacterium]|nr:TonB C-terminal domain-containing protein [Porticoccaceae bacterium]
QELARRIAIEAQVGDYVLAITQQIEEKWSRPAELRLMDLADIQAVVAVEILPTGELQSASILQASGNANYDQSVLRAIEKVRRFRVPADPEVFEMGGFRRLNIIFRPEDLMKP